jgi:hypothetical protein
MIEKILKEVVLQDASWLTQQKLLAQVIHLASFAVYFISDKHYKIKIRGRLLTPLAACVLVPGSDQKPEMKRFMTPSAL